MLLDGGLATTLQRTHGLAPFTPTTPWLDSRPRAIAGAHRAFVEAGAELVLTATFRVLPSLDPGWSAHLEVATALARGSGADKVFGSLGPPSDPGRPWDGDRGPLVELAQAYASLVDGLVLETFVSLAELTQVMDAVRPHFPGTLVVSLSPSPAAQLYDGTHPAEALRVARGAGAQLVGFNCGPGCIAAAELSLLEGEAVDWLKPNAEDGQVPDALLASVAHVGGCCGYGPAELRLLGARRRAIVSVAS